MENASRFSPRSSADRMTPMTGFTNPRIYTLLTGLYFSRLPQSVYAPAEIKPI